MGHLFQQGSDTSAGLKCALWARPISNLHWYKPSLTAGPMALYIENTLYDQGYFDFA
jgi:hypothetical protein